jgi:hypothetical protein
LALSQALSIELIIHSIGSVRRDQEKVRLSAQACNMYFVTKIALPGTAEAMVQEAVEFVGRKVETQG